MAPDRRSPFHLSLLLPLAAGAVLRLWFLRHANPLQGDALLYANIARNLLQHGVYSFVPPGRPVIPTLIRLPGYPLFLLLCLLLFGVNNVLAVELVQIAVDLLTCVLVSKLAGLLFGSRAATAVLVLAVLCPFTANYTATPLTETLTLCTIAASYLLLARALQESALRTTSPALWVLALPLSFSLLLRPEQGLLAAVLIPALMWQRFRTALGRDRVRRALVVPTCLGALVLLPLVPWALRNWHTFHVVQPLAPHYATDPGEAVPLGFQRWYRSWAIDFASTEEVYWNYDGSPILLSDLPKRAFDSAAQEAETARLLDDYNQTTQPTADFDARFEQLAMTRRRAHPVRDAVLLPLARLGNMLLRPRTELMNTQLAWWRWREARGQTVFAFAYAALNLLYLSLGVAGLWRAWPQAQCAEKTLLVAMVAFVLVRSLLLLSLDNSEPRYTLEFFPLLFVWAGALFATPAGGPISLSSGRSS